MIHHCLIIGAGQSGLACARIAQNFGLDYVVLEQGTQAGEVWRQRSPKLKLFTPRNLSALSDYPLDGDPDALPNSAEMADYFESYHKKFNINCLFNARVISTQRSTQGHWIVTCADGRQFLSYSMVLANGSNQEPIVPERLSENLSADMIQVNAENYWKTLPPSRDGCLVVGDGASGRQIAHDLACEGYEVTLAGNGRNMIPNRLMKRNVLQWLNAIGILRVNRDTWLAKLVKKRNPVPRKETLSNKALQKIGVTLVGKVQKTTHEGVCFDHDRQACFSYVVWCTGYREATSFLPLDLVPNDEWMISGRGVLPLSGVFVVGRRWLHNRASELIMGVEHDAQYTMSKLRQWLDSSSAVSDLQELQT